MKKLTIFLIIFLITACIGKRNKSIREYKLGQEFYQKGVFDTAILHFSNAYKIDSRNLNSQYSKAKSLYHIGNYDLAYELSKKLLSEKYSQDSVYSLIIEIFWKRDQLDSSLLYINFLIKINPSDYNNYLKKAMILYNIGNSKSESDNRRFYLDALDNIKIANKMKANCTECILKKGIIEFGIKDYSQSKRDFMNVVNSLNKDSLLISDAYRFLGLIQVEKNSYDSLLIYLDSSIFYDENNAYSYYNRGFAKLKLNDAEGASADFRRAYDLGIKEAYDEIIKTKNDYILESPAGYDTAAVN
jgi:tetratricopeptide (TPR) repeat protein